MANPLKSFLLMATILAIPAAGVQADTFIDGQRYPDGCAKVLSRVNGLQVWRIKCPIGQLNPRIERRKQQGPRSFGGHRSGPEVVRQAPYQSPEQCRAAEFATAKAHGRFDGWLIRMITPRSNHPRVEKVLTAIAATTLRDRMRSFVSAEINNGKNLYRTRVRGEDGDGKCAAYLKGTIKEINRVYALVRHEAAKGNRDLQGTGLNFLQSPYNN